MSREQSPGTVSRAAVDALALLGSTYVSQILTLVLAFALRRELGPDGMGYVAITQLAMSYAPYVGLGSLQAAEREVAYSRGRGDETGAIELEFSAMSAALAISISLAVALAAWSLLNLIEGQPLVGATIAAVAIIGVSQQFAMWGTIHLRTRYRFSTLGWAAAAGTVALSSLTLLGALFSGPLGALIGAAGGSILQGIILARAARLPRWRFPRLATLGRVAALSPGFLALGLTAVAIGTIDQLAVGFLLGATSLGLYSAAYLGNGFVLRVPTLVNAVIYPRLQWQMGASSNRQAVYHITRRTTAMSLLFIPLVVGAFVILLPLAIRLVLPSFIAAIPAMRLLLVGVMGLAFGMPAMQYLITLNRQWVVVATTVVFLAAMAASYVVSQQLHVMSIGMAAMVDAIAYLLYGAVLQILAAAAAGFGIRAILRDWLATFAIGAELILAGTLLDDMPGAHFSMGGAMASAVAQALPFVVSWGLLAWLTLRGNPQARADARQLIHPVRALLPGRPTSEGS